MSDRPTPETETGVAGPSTMSDTRDEHSTADVSNDNTFHNSKKHIINHLKRKKG